MDRKKTSEPVRAALLALLRGGLWEQDVKPHSCFPLSRDGWEEVFLLSKQQTVTGVAFRGLHHLPDGMLPPESLLLRWMAAADGIERKNKEMNLALDSLLTLFARHGLHPILQKGQGLASLYAYPLLRECGDIDLYFVGEKEFESASDSIQAQGIRLVRKADSSLMYSWHGVPVEHHIRLVDLYHPHHRHPKTGSAWGFRDMVLPAASGLRVTVPAPSLNLLLQYAHILKHALGRGIGLRQLCDLALSCDKWHTEVHPAILREACRQSGLGKWVPLLHTFLTDCLGLAPDRLPYPEAAPDARPLLDIIWRGGNFGQQKGSPSVQPAMLRKVQTADAFRRNLCFALHYAPKEAFGLFTNLLKGQAR